MFKSYNLPALVKALKLMGRKSKLFICCISLFCVVEITRTVLNTIGVRGLVNSLTDTGSSSFLFSIILIVIANAIWWIYTPFSCYICSLCTYGTIPVVIELYKSGVHVAPLITFLASSSLMNPQLFVMTAGGIEDIGLEMAVALAVSVIIISLVFGMLTYLIPQKYIVKKNIVLYEDGGCNIINRGKKLFMIKQYLLNCLKNLKNVGFYLLIGIILGTALELYIPKELIHNALGEQNGVRAILFASLLGIPLYACGGGAIPLVNSMIQNGMGKGSGLAFFIVGSATRPAPLAAMAALFTPLFIIAYCVFLVASAVLMGLVYF